MITARKWVAAEFGGPEVLRNIEAGVPGASNPASGPFRARARSRILKLARTSIWSSPMAETFKFEDAPAAFAALTGPTRPVSLPWSTTNSRGHPATASSANSAATAVSASAAAGSTAGSRGIAVSCPSEVYRLITRGSM